MTQPDNSVGSLLKLIEKWQAEDAALWRSLPEDEKQKILNEKQQYADQIESLKQFLIGLGVDFIKVSEDSVEGVIKNFRFYYRLHVVEGKWEFLVAPNLDFQELDYFNPEKQRYMNQGFQGDFSFFDDDYFDGVAVLFALKTVKRCLLELLLVELARESLDFGHEFLQPLIHVVSEPGINKEEMRMRISQATHILQFWKYKLEGCI